MLKPDYISGKLFESKELVKRIELWRSEKETIVFTNGCFDILHPGHIDYLFKARLLGDKLVIGLNSDDSVSRLKGPTRPINSETFRATMLAAFAFVDAIVIFNEDTPYQLISNLLPDILVKGGDYSKETIVGADVVENNGGKVVVLPFLEGFSTSNIINKIKENYER
ncbi:MAG: D-glycero-beta-D-manno-heptose 1-phosphate adenylyltransferase [Bacteroidales bacterium]|nr:D-glycero-beta-D-manno-heptose 1-phosphate adenylyltransferase [Bacteroidales bacterium]